ncbi:MAG: hypothetical protein HQL94_06815 [Magnetococcales bacterium]|nr:hypothetical protein [Magnetococcales bacterium]
MNEKFPDSETNWIKVDEHIIQPEEYEELPEWTDAMFAAANAYENGRLIHRDRTRQQNTL